VVDGTGWDEIVMGVILFVFGFMQLRFREAMLRRTARTYARWNDAFPRFMKIWRIEYWSQEPVIRWVHNVSGVVCAAVGLGLVVWAIVWGWSG
jgi:hypothetical protein